MPNRKFSSDLASQAHPELLSHQKIHFDQDILRSKAKSTSPVTKASIRDDLSTPEIILRPQECNETYSKSIPELKVVYRILRLISDWALSGFFADVCVEGAENVHSEGALILTPCHHNEIIDIATLSATIPHRRIIAYWTKASLFKNSVSRFILRSAGAIPVSRSARPQAFQAQDRDNVEMKNDRSAAYDGSTSPGSASKRGQSGQQALFDATYKEFAKREGGGGVLAVFPEGTSYTMPRIVQVKEGAARVALSYVRWLRDRDGDIPKNDAAEVEMPVSIIPVGIVYTNKSCYRSRLYVRYGTPIDLRPFVNRCFLEDKKLGMDENSRYQNAVRGITEEVERGMFALTINAPDWDTLYAAQTARAILWADERSLRLADFVKVSNILINLFERPPSAILELRKSLLRYHALLYHTGLTHAAVAHVPFPPSDLPSNPTQSILKSARHSVLSYPSIIKILASLPSLLIALFLSLPTHLAHTPAYVFGALTSSVFAGEEEEARAQYKVIFGGLGRAGGTFAAAFALVRSVGGRAFLQLAAKTVVKVLRSSTGMVGRALSAFLPANGSVFVEKLGERYMYLTGSTLRALSRNWSRSGILGDMIGILGVAWLLCAWHARVIDSNYIRYKRVRATFSILRAVLFSSPHHADVRENDRLKPYLVTPKPPMNPFIAKSWQSASEDVVMNSGPLPPALNVDGVEASSWTQVGKKVATKPAKSVLVRHLLMARAEAVGKLHSAFCELESAKGVTQPGDNNSITGIDGVDVQSPHYDTPGGEERRSAADVTTLRKRGAVF